VRPGLVPSLSLYFLIVDLKDLLTMPPTAQAVIFALTELCSPGQVETMVVTLWPPGVSLADLRALLTSPPVSHMPYHDHLVDVAANLVLAGHQRNLQQVLQDLGFLPLLAPLPPLEVKFLFLYFPRFGLVVGTKDVICV
jgi:hypothetical protein